MGGHRPFVAALLLPVAALAGSHRSFVRRETSAVIGAAGLAGGFRTRSDGLAELAAARARLRVGFAIFVTDVRDKSYEDAIAVLAHGIRQSAQRSRDDVEVLALAPTRLDSRSDLALRRAGIQKILKFPLLVDPDIIQRPQVREAQLKHSSDGSFQFAEEQIKYYGLHLTEFDRVLVLDADCMVLEPMDELMRLPEDLVATYDHGLDTSHSTTAPVQGGFLLFRPSLQDLDAIRNLTIEGDFRYDGTGWLGTGIGFAYGGTGPDGMLAYFYQRGALPHLQDVGKAQLPERLRAPPLAGSRLRAVDRAVYDVVLNERLRREVDDLDHDSVLRAVKSAHFTGDCPKPWSCLAPGHWLCEGLHDRWWKQRSELEASRGLTASPQACQEGHYVPIAQVTDGSAMAA